jgi:DNA-binding NtrC family response regulator
LNRVATHYAIIAKHRSDSKRLEENSLRVAPVSPGAESAFHDSKAGDSAMPTPGDILIIDDEVSIVDFMIEALKDEGYSVRSANNGERGLSEIAVARPAVVLLDMHMPGITTTEFLDRLCAHDHLPIVIMTADKTGADSLSTQHDLIYLPKPFDLDTLMECVAKFVPPPLSQGR